MCSLCSVKSRKSELVIADQLRDMLRKTREALSGNIDPKDPQYILLYDELRRLFAKKNLDEITQEEMKQNIGQLQQIYEKVTELNRKNNLLKSKYNNDPKYVRIHKRIRENKSITILESKIGTALNTIKREVDDRVLLNTNVLNNEGYFDGLMMQTLINNFDKLNINMEPKSARFVNNCVVREYIDEFNGVQL